MKPVDRQDDSSRQGHDPSDYKMFNKMLNRTLIDWLTWTLASGVLAVIALFLIAQWRNPGPSERQWQRHLAEVARTLDISTESIMPLVLGFAGISLTLFIATALTEAAQVASGDVQLDALKTALMIITLASMLATAVLGWLVLIRSAVLNVAAASPECPDCGAPGSLSTLTTVLLVAMFCGLAAATDATALGARYWMAENEERIKALDLKIADLREASENRKTITTKKPPRSDYEYTLLREDRRIIPTPSGHFYWTTVSALQGKRSQTSPSAPNISKARVGRDIWWKVWRVATVFALCTGFLAFLWLRLTAGWAPSLAIAVVVTAITLLYAFIHTALRQEAEVNKVCGRKLPFEAHNWFVYTSAGLALAVPIIGFLPDLWRVSAAMAFIIFALLAHGWYVRKRPFFQDLLRRGMEVRVHRIREANDRMRRRQKQRSCACTDESARM